MDDLDFTEEEIKEQLENLGYTNVSDARLKEFKRGKWIIHCLLCFCWQIHWNLFRPRFQIRMSYLDLERLVQHERSKNSSCSTVTTVTNETTVSSAGTKSDDNDYFIIVKIFLAYFIWNISSRSKHLCSSHILFVL